MRHASPAALLALVFALMPAACDKPPPPPTPEGAAPSPAPQPPPKEAAGNVAVTVLNESDLQMVVSVKDAGGAVSESVVPPRRMHDFTVAKGTCTFSVKGRTPAHPFQKAGTRSIGKPELWSFTVDVSSRPAPTVYMHVQ